MTGAVEIGACHDVPDAITNTAKTPARRWRSAVGDKRGSVLRSLTSRPDRNPAYILDFSLGCRCQGVGNWELPGGVMRVTHPPAELATIGIWHRFAGGARENAPRPSKTSEQATKP